MTMRIVEYRNRFEVKFDWDRFAKTNLNALKAIGDGRYDPVSKIWRFPLDKRYEVEYLKTSCKATLIKEKDMLPKMVGEVPAMPELTDILPELNEGVELMAYQNQGVAANLKFGSAFNCDEPGLGKTIQTIATITATKSFPALIVCPSSLKYNWASEFKKFSGIRAMILDDRNKDSYMNFYTMGMVDVFITNFESMPKFLVKKMPTKRVYKSNEIELRKEAELLKTIVFDECHKLKNPSTRQTKIALRIATGKPHVYMLTGTPVVNNPVDLYPQLAIAGYLDKFGGRKGFLERYCEGGNGSNNLKELNYKLSTLCYFRRLKKDVLTQLPDKRRQTITCDISTRKEYDFAYNEFSSFLKSSGFNKDQIDAKMRGEILVKMNYLRSISAKGKIEAACEHIDELVDAGEKVVVFASLREILGELKLKYPGAAEIHGGISVQQRDANVKAFQNDPKCKVILCNIKAGGVGLTLTASSNVLFVEYPWTWADCIQCEDRTHRNGQLNSVTCTYLMGADTIDERLFEMIQTKKDISEAVTGTEDQSEMKVIDKVFSLFNV